MKSTEDECNILEGKSVLSHEEKWTLAERGTLEDALDVFFPFRNIPYKSQLAVRSKELDQTLDDIVKRSKDAFAKDLKYSTKPPIKKPPLEDIIPTIPNVGYERTVTLGLEKDATGTIRAGIRVLYEKDGNKQFLLPLPECSNIAPQIVKAAEATAAFLTDQKFNVYDGVENCEGIYALKFTMNEIGEIIMSLQLVMDDINIKDILEEEEEDGKHESGVAANAKGNTVSKEEVRMGFFIPGRVTRQTFILKTAVNSQMKKHLEEYTPALKKFVEDNRTRLAVVGVYITWHDAESPPEQKTAAQTWYHVAGNKILTETINSTKVDLFPHLENLLPSRTHSIPTIMKTLVDGLSLQKESSLVLLLSEYYIVPSLISQKCKQAAVSADMHKSLKSYLKEKSGRKHGVLFATFPRDNSMHIFDYAPRTSGAVIHWERFKDAEPIKLIIAMKQQQRPRKIAWVVDTREDNSGTNKCSNADLLERNHMMLYPYYTLERVVGIDVGPQKSEPLTLVAFYERYDGAIRMNPKQERSTKEGDPKAEMKVPPRQVPGGCNAKRKALGQPGPGDRSERNGVGRSGAQKETGHRSSNNPEGPSRYKRPRRVSGPQPHERGDSSRSSSLRARRLMGLGGRSLNPWGDYPSNRPMAAPDQTTTAVLSQLTTVIEKQLLLAQMNNALQLTSGSSIREMTPDRGVPGDYCGYDRPSEENYDFPPPPPKQLPTVLTSFSTRHISPLGEREDYRSTVREDITRDNLMSTSREDSARDEFRGAARQEFSRDDFWSTPLKDLARNEFRSVSPRRENYRDSIASREAVRNMSTSRKDFQRDNYRSARREDLMKRDYFRSSEREEFRSTSPIQEDVQSMSPDREVYTHCNFRRASEDDYLLSSGFGSSARENVTRERLKSTTWEDCTRDDASRAAWEDSWEDSQIAARDDFSGRGDLRSATWDNPQSFVRNDSTRDNFRSTTREGSTSNNIKREEWDLTRRESARDYRSAVQDLFTRTDSRETVTHSDLRKAATRGDFTRDSRGTVWGDSRSGAREDSPYDTRRVAQDFKRAATEGFRSAARDDIFNIEFKDTSQEDLTRNVFGSRKSYGTSPRGGFDSVGRNSTGAGSSSFRDSGKGGFKGSVRYPSSGRFSGDHDVWGDDYARRN